MKVQGYEVPEAKGQAETVGEIKLDDGVVMRLADRLIQKHSKAGNITKRSQQGERARWGWKR